MSARRGAAAQPRSLEPIDKWVIESATRGPGTVAVVSPDITLTYGQLLVASSKIASRLRRAGLSEPDPIVAVCLDRMGFHVPAILGCWQAGTAFLPIDPQVPPDRVDYMVRDAGVAVALASRRRPPYLPASVEVIYVEDVVAGSSGADVSSASSLTGLAYVIYTSGSTGTPKGVPVEHGSLSQYAAAVAARLRLPNHTRWAVVSSFSTDLAHTGLFAALITRGTVHVLPREVAVDGVELGRYVEENAIDCMKITPTHYNAMLEADRPPAPRLRVVMGGERLTWRVVERVRSILPPNCLIYNHYGPTETTVGVIASRCGIRRADESDVPLGQPLDGVHVFIQSAPGTGVAGGQAGELVIAGRQVARGYLNRPTETAASFVTTQVAGADWPAYRTGDLAFMRRDGLVAFLGRDDDQVKIRGHRVEVAEVEGRLVSHPALSDAVVVAYERDESLELAAFVRPADREAPSSEALRSYLAEWLPEQMLPSRIESLSKLPLLASGKVDRTALSDLARGTAAEATSRIRASYEGDLSLEARILRVFRLVLGDSELRPSDDFFLAGGNSLAAIRAIADIRASVGRVVPLALLFIHPTVEALTRAMRAEGAS